MFKSLLSSPCAYLLVASSLLVPVARAQTPTYNTPAPAIPADVAAVNPFVGTAEHGHTYPGATMPFGMVQLSPDTPLQGWDGSSGYHYSDSVIRGFSHSHLSGTGVGGLGDILLMPTVGDVQLSAGDPGKTAGYASRFSHDREAATPGYYRVFLDDPKITAELTATERCGLHKYTFPAANNAHIVLDLQHGIGNNVAESGLTVENNTTISGYRASDGWGGRRTAYFVMEFSKPFASYGVERDGARVPDVAALGGKVDGKAVKAFVDYNTRAGETILVRVGISGTGIEGARRNLNAEIPDFDFNKVHAKAVSAWNDNLSEIQVESRDPKIVRTFYSNLYQSYLGPVLFNDVDGMYRGPEGKNYPGSAFQNYTTFSLWDTFRAQAPLLTLTEPNRIADMVNSMTMFEAERGRNEMPVWTLWGNETGTMIGYNSAPVIADAYLKGFTGFNAEAAYQALKRTALNGRNGQDEFGKNGYVISGGKNNQSVARTLEFAYDDWCIAQMAAKLGHTEDAAMFMKRAANFVNVYDGASGFMRGRTANGDWRRPFDPDQLAWADYTEANSWHYTWAVMQDPQKLVKLMGGDAAFINKMDAMFTTESKGLFGIPDITGLIGEYAHGNEPVHHAAYLYSYAGAPYKTQARVREIMTKLYNDTPAGAPGNNDVGQMSAWYVFSALGFYPVNPAQGVYVIGSPAVDKATIKLDKNYYGGRTFTMTARNNSPQNVYIQSAMLNGKALNNSYITHNQILAGGTLDLVMGSKPNMNWGKAEANRPPAGMPANYAYPAPPAPAVKIVQNWTVPIRVVAGSYNDVDGFKADFTNENGAVNGNGETVDVSAPNAAPMAVYQTERYGNDVSYAYPVPKGATYTVRLHFAEIFGAAPGERVENISINGKPVLTNFSVAAEVGQNKALVKEFTGIAPDEKGNITIRVEAAPGSKDSNAKISAIEILKP